MANITIPSMQELLSAGVHFGHKVSRGNPRMKQFIFGARDGVHIIDLEQSEEKLKEVAQAAYDLGHSGKVMVVVGTKKQARPIIEELAQATGTAYITERWVGGLLTNFDELKKNFNRLSTLKTDQEAGKLAHYTKKEQLLMTRKIGKFEKELGGVATLDKVPDAMFIIDAVSDSVAVSEAKKTGLVILGMCDTNADPTLFTYPVPANDDGIKSIRLLVETILNAYAQGKKEAGVKAEKAAQAEQQKKDEDIAKEEAKASEKVEEEAAVIEEQVEKEILVESKRTEE